MVRHGVLYDDERGIEGSRVENVSDLSDQIHMWKVSGCRYGSYDMKFFINLVTMDLLLVRVWHANSHNVFTQLHSIQHGKVREFGRASVILV